MQKNYKNQKTKIIGCKTMKVNANVLDQLGLEPRTLPQGGMLYR